MNSIIILNALSIIGLTKKINKNVLITLHSLLSLFVLSASFGLLESLSLNLGAIPLALIPFYAACVLEIYNGREKNAALIIFLSFSTLIAKAELFYLFQVLSFVLVNLQSPFKENTRGKILLILYLLIWPSQIIFYNSIPHSLYLTIFPLLMSYGLLLKVFTQLKLSSALIFALVISQYFFLTNMVELPLNAFDISILFGVGALTILLIRKASDFLFPMIVIAPILFEPSHSLKIISILFALRIFTERKNNGVIFSKELSSHDILQIGIVILSSLLIIAQVTNIYLAVFIFCLNFLSIKNSPFEFLRRDGFDFSIFASLLVLVASILMVLQ